MYRIYTEDVNRSRIRKVLDAHLQGYTLLKGEGVWQGQREKSLVIEIAATPKRIVRKVAELIKSVNRQQSVLVVTIPNRAEFV